MKRSEAENFAIPTRQSIVAIILIIYKYINLVVRQIWPFLLIFLVGGSGKKMYFASGLAVLAGVSMIWAILSYFKFYFYIENKELVIQKGILKKTNLNIPFERIQTVNIKQNIIHQILNVVQLEVDTAGTAKAEFKFDALSKANAELLRSILIQGSQEAKEGIVDEGHDSTLPTYEVEEQEIVKLSIFDLLKVGVGQNHFRSVGFVLLILFWVQESIQELGFETDGYVDNAFDFVVGASFRVIVTLVVIAMVIALVISLVRTVLIYFDMKLRREGDRLKLSHGLFNKKEISALYQKIQILQWGNNPLQKLLKIFDVNLKQASSSEVTARKSLRIPGCELEQVNYLKNSWLTEAALSNLHLNGVSIHYFYRRVMYRLLFSFILIGICIYFEKLDGWFYLFVLMVPYYITTSWLVYKKSGFAVNDQILYISSGMLEDKFALMPLHKIQNIKIKQSPYQLRKELSDVQVFTASGNITIPYLPLNLAKKISDYCLYKVQTSQKEWM